MLRLRDLGLWAAVACCAAGTFLLSIGAGLIVTGVGIGLIWWLTAPVEDDETPR